ncbi:MAG: ArgE/DapE family deacylase [Marmoricola sp.]
MTEAITSEALTSAEVRALLAIDADATVSLLMELLAVPSVSGSDAECDIQHLLAGKLRTMDLDVDSWAMDLDSLGRAANFPGVETERTEAWGLVGTRWGQTAAPALILQGHVDVVPPGDFGRWQHAPFRPTISEARIHGRGACDMKAGVAANVAALAAVQKAGVVLRDTFALHFVIGEEDGGLGAFGTLRRGHTGQTCIITEPTSGTLTTANAGALTFSVAVPGLATHASTSYAGSSAIDSYVAIHRGLHELQVRRNEVVDPLMSEYPVAYPISVGRVRGGDWSSSVPDLLIAEGRMGVRIDEDVASARTELEEHVAELSRFDPFLRDHPATVTWSGGQYAGGRMTTGHQLGAMVADAHADATGTARPRERGAPYGSDLRLYQAGGITTLHYGPGDVRLAHGPNESVDVQELLDVTQTLVLCILRSCRTIS